MKRKIDGTAREWKRKAENAQHRATTYAVVLGAASAFVADDATAATYQTLGQYRSAVLRLLTSHAPLAAEEEHG